MAPAPDDGAAGLFDDSSTPAAKEAPHYHGHRDRLREKFAAAGGEALPDYELLELVLFRAIPRRDVKPLAKALVELHGGWLEIRSAKGVGTSVIAHLPLLKEVA